MLEKLLRPQSTTLPGFPVCPVCYFNLLGQWRLQARRGVAPPHRGRYVYTEHICQASAGPAHLPTALPMATWDSAPRRTDSQGTCLSVGAVCGRLMALRGGEACLLHETVVCPDCWVSITSAANGITKHGNFPSQELHWVAWARVEFFFIKSECLFFVFP
ncbi:unnamed protein product [Protopolystoma xenopodis]|uniref:Uncharacterized protein n=1 Tax=Protopolystoma xenopodis TaxID=117903 RepID=A0A3S5B6Q3_9PLAT|nr:unnamed protein product [Protopolystoma xenopodis]